MHIYQHEKLCRQPISENIYLASRLLSREMHLEKEKGFEKKYFSKEEFLKTTKIKLVLFFTEWCTSVESRTIVESKNRKLKLKTDFQEKFVRAPDIFQEIDNSAFQVSLRFLFFSRRLGIYVINFILSFYSTLQL